MNDGPGIEDDALEWLKVVRASEPLVVTMPHTGTWTPPEIEGDLASQWLAHKDTDWWIERLYDFATGFGATVIRMDVSRTVIDANRDPSGVSLYPGQATTELCPTTTFDGEPLYRPGHCPGSIDIAARRRVYFDPYHRAVNAEIARLRSRHSAVVLYDCHSIRSIIPRLFAGTLPNFNIGTHSGASCDPALTKRVEAICDGTDFTRVTNGRFKGGYTTRHYGRPEKGVHAIQMELACRGYMRETPGEVTAANWPCAYDEEFAAPMRAALERILRACIDFARTAG